MSSGVAATNPDLPALGIITDYASLHETLRRRADQLQLSRETLDSLTGLASGHCAKLLAPAQTKKLGQTSFGLLLAALGLQLIAAEDPDAMRRYEKLRTPRCE